LFFLLFLLCYCAGSDGVGVLEEADAVKRLRLFGLSLAVCTTQQRSLR
jgi:hypothetical protein